MSRTSPYYPQSNGKIERWHKALKSTALRPAAPADLDHARTVVTEFVDPCHPVRLHSAIGYITPYDFLQGRSKAIWAERDRKLDEAREKRRQRRENVKKQAAA